MLKHINEKLSGIVGIVLFVIVDTFLTLLHVIKYFSHFVLMFSNGSTT